MKSTKKQIIIVFAILTMALVLSCAFVACDKVEPDKEDVCEHVEVTDNAVEPTCTEKGLTEGKHCSKCGKILQAQTEIPALGHDFSNEWTIDKEATCTEKGSKSHHCTRCEVKSDETEIPTIEHSESDWIIDKEATCTEDGSKHTECTVCHTMIKTENISALGHTGGTATCTEQATCSVCGEKYGDALGHKYGDLIPKTEPTCSENGVEAHYKCSVCNKVFKDDEHKTETTLDELTIAINPNAHNFGEWIKNEGADTHTRVCSFNSEHTETESCHGGTATCTEQAICERCGNKYGESLGHAIVHHEAKAPTCTEIGWEAYDTCSRCDYTTYVEIPAGHNFNESGVCNACGYFETGLAFELNEDGESYSVVGIGTFDGTDLKIPNVNFDTKPVTGIKSNAFENCGSLTSVTIPDSVTSIGSYAFDGCNNLQDIYITDIGAWCNIAGLSNLMEYGASNKKLYINNELATSITIPDSVTSISYSAFRGCTELTSVTIPDSVTSIGPWAFEGCTGLTTVNWNATACTSAGSYNSPIFKGCSNLATVNIGDNVKIIPHYAFYNCTGLTNVTIPDSVTSIGDSAFSNCTGLTSVTIGDSVTSIGQSAFSDCTGLTSVTIGNSVTSIGQSAFWSCTGLTSVTIPDSVTSIGSSAFYNTAWYNNQSAGLVYAGQVAYKYKGTMSSNTSIVLKEGTLGIGGGAFRDCTGLTSITIPDSVTSIGGSAFSDCTGLTSITIPDSVTSIGGGAFFGCTGLTSITIPDSVTSIDFGAFEGCTGLTTVNWNATECTSDGSSYYPIFKDCSNLATVNIGDNVKIIPPYAFKGCTRLTSVTIPDSVTSIGGGAFDNTLWYDDQPDGLVFAGKVAYKYKGTMPSNTSILLKEGTLGIADSAFEGCTGLTSITIPNSVTSIGYEAFQNCTGLTSITIGGSVTSIGSNAFYGCKGLTSITIPNSVTSIDSYAFFYCTGLTSIKFNGTIEQWNAISKGSYWKYNVPATQVGCTDGTVSI